MIMFCLLFRPYHCADCGKSYKDSASFKRHRLVHSGERPYTCILCSENFIDSKALRRHREVTHPNEPDLESIAGDEDYDEEEDLDNEMSETPAAATTSSSKNVSSSSSSAYSSMLESSREEEREAEIDDDEEDIDVEEQDEGNGGSSENDEKNRWLTEERALCLRQTMERGRWRSERRKTNKTKIPAVISGALIKPMIVSTASVPFLYYQVPVHGWDWLSSKQALRDQQKKLNGEVFQTK